MTKNCHTKTFLMKKITSLLAIAAVALTAALSFGSCSKNDDPAVEPEDKVLPVDSIMATLAYEFSEDALQLIDVKYEVTDYKGNKETITVTEPGHFEKDYKSADINAKASVKLIATYKNNIDEIKKDSLDFKFISEVSEYMYVDGKLISLNDNFGNLDPYDEKVSKSDFENFIYWFPKEPVVYSIYLIENLKKGVTESWLKDNEYRIIK